MSFALPFGRQVCLVMLVLGGTLLGAAAAQAQVPAPADVFGFEPGADYKMADYGQLTRYYRQLSTASERVRMTEIGTSVEGRSLKLLVISSAENLQSLDRWRTISATLARARVGEGRARRLAETGKAVVWIDAGLHATERAPGQAMPALAHRLATGDSAEMQSIRENTVVLLMPMMNPDGLADMERWYDRVLNTPYETTDPPWLYHTYAGHDNNRDWFMNNLPETRAVTEVLFNEWYPQIVLNHHQTSPEWARIFIPPFAGPVNPRIHPDVVAGVNKVGDAMGERFAAKQMPGVISSTTYTMYWNGGMRTVPYYHNQLGILTEVAHATPSPQYYAIDSASARTGAGGRSAAQFETAVWAGGSSHFRDAVRYTNTASMGVLAAAARAPADYLYNMYTMGRDAIEAGRAGDPYAYVVPPDQWLPREAHNLINILRQGGVEVERATAAFEADGRRYPAGSFVVPAAQAFRPYILDLLEPQAYPTPRTPDGAVQAPYDLAGWTLPMQMGVRVERVDTSFEARLRAVTDSVAPGPGAVTGPAEYGYRLSHRSNASVEAVQALLNDGEAVYWAGRDGRGAGGGQGDIVVRRAPGTAARMEALAEHYGLDVQGLSRRPHGPLHRLRSPRVAIYKSWVPSRDEGWTRWVLEQYDVPVDTLHDADLRNGDLSRYTTIILPHHRSTDVLLHGHERGSMPRRFVGGMGKEGVRALDRYVERGGHVVAFDRAARFAIQHLGLPVRDVTQGLSRRAFSVPGSLLRATVKTNHPLGYGMRDTVAVSVTQGRAFEAVPRLRVRKGGGVTTDAPPVEVVARYAERDLLMSGWAQGARQHIGGEAAMMRVKKGRGAVVLFGFRPQFRGQPRGTYKLFFNALHAAAMEGPSTGRPTAQQPPPVRPRRAGGAGTEK